MMAKTTEKIFPIQYFPNKEKPRQREGERRFTFTIEEGKFSTRKTFVFQPEEITNIPQVYYLKMREYPSINTLFEDGALHLISSEQTAPQDINEVDLEIATEKIQATTDITELLQIAQHIKSDDLKEIVQKQYQILQKRLKEINFPALEVPTGEQGIKHLGIKDIKVKVKKVTNIKILKQWQQDEPRPEVQKVLIDRITELNSAVPTT